MKKYYICFILICSPLFAQFDWDDNGLFVRQGYHVEWFRGGDISSDGNMIVVWSDTRESARKVYAQSVDNIGNINWDIDGVLISSDAGRHEDPIIISDNFGGGYISWRTYTDSNPTQGELNVQHIDLDGNLLWDEPIQISADIPIRVNSQQNMCSDRNGGVYVTWYAEGSPVGDGYYYGIHIISNGSMVGPIVLIDTDDDYGNVSLESSGNASATIVWKQGGFGTENIYAQRIKADYTTNTINKLWNEGTPLDVATYDGRQISPKVTYFSDVFVAVVWEHWPAPSTSSIAGNLISANGELQFQSDGTNDVIHTLDYPTSSFPRVKSTSLGAFVVWLSADDKHYVQKFSPNHINEWSTPILLETQGTQEQARLSADANGGVYVTWEDDNSIAIQYVDSNGNISISEPIISDVNTEQFSPLVRADSDKGAFVVWAKGAANINGIGTATLEYQYIDLELDSGLEDGYVSLFYGFGGQIEKGSTKITYFDNNNNLIYWQDYRNGVNYPQTYGGYGGELEFESIKLLSEYPYQNSPQIVKIDESTFFLGFYNQDEQVYFQLLDNELNTIGDAEAVNENGNQQASDDSQPFLISNGMGTAYYAYSENPGFGDIYIQKYNHNGNAEWDVPKLIADNVGDDLIRYMVPMDDGGCIIIHDLLFFPIFANVKLTRLDSEGAFVEGWENIYVSPDGEEGYFENAIETELGLYITWRDGDSKVLAKYIPYNASDPSNIDILNISDTGNLYTESLAIDYNLFSHEVLSCWQEEISSVYNIHCVAKDLDNLQEDPEVIIIYEDLNNVQRNPSVKSTLSGNYLVTWEDERLGNYTDLYIQEINSNGDTFLESDGTILCNANFNQFNSKVESIDNDANTFIVFWEDDRSSGKEFVTNIFSQKVSLENNSDCTNSVGDVNEDGVVNVLDIVQTANEVLGGNVLSTCGLEAADMNSDGVINILDIVQIANIILGQ